MNITPLCLVLFGIAALVVATAAMPTDGLDGGISKHPTSLADFEEFGSLSRNFLPEEANNLVMKTRKTSGRRKKLVSKLFKELGKRAGKHLVKVIIDAALKPVLNKITGNTDETTDSGENSILNKILIEAL